MILRHLVGNDRGYRAEETGPPLTLRFSKARPDPPGSGDQVHQLAGNDDHAARWLSLQPFGSDVTGKGELFQGSLSASLGT